MPVRARTAPVMRPRRLVLVAVASLALMAGCKHHRQSLRPIYVSPAPAAVVPEAYPPATLAPSAVEAEPGFIEEGGPITTPPSLSAPADEMVTPQSRGEPQLEPVDGVPSLNSPQTFRGRDRRRTAVPASAQRGTLRSRVEAFVNDPADLFQPPKADRNWRYIVMHHSAHATGSYAQIDRDHRQNLGTDGCGYHFVIGNGTDSPDGQIEVARRWSEQKPGAHCRDARKPEANDYGIGICLIGDLDNAAPTPRQVEAARALVAYLSDRYRITSEHVGTHSHLSQNGSTVCPGKNFPVEAILGGRNLVSR